MKPFVLQTICLLLSGLILFGVFLLDGCKSRTAHEFEAEVLRCQANETQIAEVCPTQTECQESLMAERARCDAALQEHR